MLLPKKVKYRKWQTKRVNPKKSRVETRGTTVAFGSFGLKALETGRLKSEQLESARKVVSRFIGKTGKIWIRVFPDKPTTKKALGVRMGSGKGDIHQYVAVIKPGRILFEIAGVTIDVAREAFRNASAKIPFGVKLVEK